MTVRQHIPSLTFHPSGEALLPFKGPCVSPGDLCKPTQERCPVCPWERASGTVLP